MERRTLEISAAALCAALYSVSNIAFAAVPTPWGVGQFRPGVIIPAVFVILFGPWVGAVGAALGTQLSSFFLPTGLGPVGSLVSGVPGNFLGFLLVGRIINRRRDSTGFLTGSLLGLLFGNLIAASGVMFWLTLIVPKWASWAFAIKVGVVLGFTIFWFATMLPFVLLLVPILIRGVGPLIKRMNLMGLEVAPDTSKLAAYYASAIAAILAIVSIDRGVASTLFYAVQPIYRDAILLLFGASAIIVLAYGIGVKSLLKRIPTIG